MSNFFIKERKLDIKIYLHGDYDVWYVQYLLQVAPDHLSTSELFNSQYTASLS